jgi:hypothetical protein
VTCSNIYQDLAEETSGNLVILLMLVLSNVFFLSLVRQAADNWFPSYSLFNIVEIGKSTNKPCHKNLRYICEYIKGSTIETIIMTQVFFGVVPYSWSCLHTEMIVLLTS